MASLLSPIRSAIAHPLPKPSSTIRQISQSQRTHFATHTRPNTQSHHGPKRRKLTASYATVLVADTGRSSTRRILTNTLLSLSSFLIGGYLALSYAPPYITSLIMGSIPTNAETLLYEAPDEQTRQIDEHIKNHPLAVSLRANPDFEESRPHLKIPENVRHHNLTAGTLSGPDKIPVPPYYFNEKGGKSMVCIFYAGKSLSGHPGIVHGGFLATMLDEGLARCAFPAMPNKVGVTANLTINYKKPTMAGQYLVLTAKTTKVEGRKAWAEGWIEPLEDLQQKEAETDVAKGGEVSKGTRLVEATALFIEPKGAKVLKSLYRTAA